MDLNNIDYALFSVDPVILSIIDGELCVLTVKRASEPFQGCWGLPGGRVDKSCDSLDTALAKKLLEKTGLDNVFFEQVQTYGARDMDPRGWSVTTSFMSLVNEDQKGLDVALCEGARWLPVKSKKEILKLAFWHGKIVNDAVDRLCSKALYTDLPVNFMPDNFTFHSLRKVYEVILGSTLTRQAFTKRMAESGVFIDTGLVETGKKRPAPLYRRKSRGGFHTFNRQIQVSKKD